ncbi:YezD family protein [Desulforegula conservatrix]|uniref:YezD family protein n=1 Tax=Desulforegula conservatrix TaxID=153026 RepID=UPI0003FC1A47|nr:YezD family protein [Desulforegula conservatrix]
MKIIDSITESEKETYCQTKNGQWVSVVREFIKDLKFGDVILTVHDGCVVQVQKTEKVRF